MMVARPAVMPKKESCCKYEHWAYINFHLLQFLVPPARLASTWHSIYEQVVHIRT